ncbi:muconate/chloromuconate family cycloisomerase [Pseudonocardia sp. GCM10023141]|uniref:muconate/chloromuconate family cycloisomerase n=1 Tax=Pseudonocardia sp. GCM10023141 TaxID=3252653 RepID=UPI00360E9858
MTDTTITEVHTTIVDLPSKRPHRFAATTMSQQSIVAVRVRIAGGLEGVGEGVTPGGPWWGGESVETIKSVIDRYLAPLLVGHDSRAIGAAVDRMDGFVAANPVAKAAVETALWDLRGKLLGVPVSDLLGGLRRDRIPITWAFSAAPVADLVDELAEKLEVGHRSFKFKMGAEPAHLDSRRVLEVLERIPDECAVFVDTNGRWSEIDAMRWLPVLIEAGVTVVEQPIARWDIAGLANLTRRLTVPVMADETVASAQQALDLVKAGAVNAFAVKIPKCGGLSRAREVAAVADGAGLACFGAATPETSIMASISSQLYGTMHDLSLGCELFGPALLVDEVVEQPMVFEGADLVIPTGPGSGVVLDEEKLRKYARD